MKILHLGRSRLILMAALCAGLFIFSTLTRAAENGFPIYFENSKLIVKSETVNRTTYLPLLDIVQFLKLSYTDALSLETFTIRNGNFRLVLTKNSGLISINDQIVLLRNPILRENDRWLVPIDFLVQGLGPITGTTYRYRSGTSRVFAGNMQPSELVMNAQTLGSITRLTLRVGAAATLSLNRDEPRRTLIMLNRNPLEPLRERVDHRDRLVRSIAYDDSDGTSKIVVETTDDVADVRITPAEGNQVFFVDFSRITSAKGGETAPTPGVPMRPDAPSLPGQNRLRVIVLDPGHGGLDVGTRNAETSEKDITLAIARKLRLSLQSRLGVTVLMTRDSDLELDNEARSAVANNNQANLFISLHVGYSANSQTTAASIFVMKEDFGGSAVPSGSRDRMFLPWYLGYRTSQTGSMRMARLLQEELSKDLPDWKFPLRTAPLGVLTSTTMPALVLEIGNIANDANVQTLANADFQNRIVTTIVNAVQRYSENLPSTAAF